MVYSGLFPAEGDDFERLREALDKLRLNDSALVYQPETSRALGFGFRCGFLGLLHMEIVRERLEREYDLDLVATAPSVAYRATTTDGTVDEVRSPQDLPEQARLAEVAEPLVAVMILTPTEYVGTVMELVRQRRGEMGDMNYLSPERVELDYRFPLAEIVFDFFDDLKFAAARLRLARLRAQRLPARRPGPCRDPPQRHSRRRLLHDRPPRQGVQLREGDGGAATRVDTPPAVRRPVQATIGTRVIARETIKAKRKDVLAKCYGGDITRKRKLLERQKEGKKRMKMVGNVEVPQEAFISALRIDG